MKKHIFFLVFLFLFAFSAKASHVPGGNITYQCVGPNTYVVTLTLFEDCGTAFETNGPEPITISNNCGYTSVVINGQTQNISTSVSLQNLSFQQEVSQLCIQNLPSSECNGGTLPGVWMHVWQDTIVLPGPCDSWTFSYDNCCRNASNNLTGTGNNYYWESVLNSTTAPCNSSPIITSQPIPYYCINQPVIYNFGVYEPDGNTLVYSLIDAMTSAAGTAPYQGGFTGSVPIPGISIDPNTGEITFTPTAVGNFVVVVLIEEYDANGNLVGSIIQDFQFEVINTAGCTNNNPSPPNSGISNFSSTGVQTGPTDIQLCEGDYVCFDVEFTDSNVGDSIYLSSNADQLFPGATFTQNTFFSPASATVCFTVLPGSNPFSTISIDAADNACPVVGISSMVVGVTVVTSTYAGQDVIMCQGVGTQLNASGGSNFNWVVLSGDPINLGTNFSCNNCPDPIANPAVSTVYQVTSNLAGGCTNVDTVEVTVVPDFTYSLTQSSTSTCLNSEIQLNVAPNPPGNYTYSWAPGSFLNNTTISNPTVMPTIPGNFDYEITMTSPDGCVKVDVISINVAPAYAPDVTFSASDTSIFCGDTIFMNLDLGGGIPAVCGASATTSCSAAASQQTLGTNQGTNSSTNWPSPFGNWYRNAKHQFLFTAAELQAAGFVGGKITEISWETTASNNATSLFMDYSIKMGCTSTSSLSVWETGLTTVFSPQNINVNLGWNTLVLTTAYEWDGISNIVMEICYDNLSTSYTYNWTTPYQQTTFNSSLYYYSDITPACPYMTSQTVSNNRPVTRFTTCPTIPDPNNFSFQWTPNTFISNNAIQNPYALPLVNTTYTAVVTDLNGGCTDTVSLSFNVFCDTCLAPVPTLTPVTCYGGNDGAILAQPAGIDGPPWQVELVDPTNSAILQSDNNVITTTTFSGLSAGDYIVRSIDTAGCYADTLVTILEPPQMVLTVSNDTIICIGGTAVISANATGGTGPYTFNWPGLSGSGPHPVSPAISNYYQVTAVDDLGCVSTQDSVLVAINPPILLTPSANDTVCPGGTGTLSVNANGGQGGTYNYVWTDASGTQVGNTSTVDVIPGNSPATYYVMVTDNCETPAAYDSLYVYWYQEPQVSFLTTNNTGCYPIEPSFTNTTPSNQVLTCVWDFGDATTSTVCGTVSHIYDQPGTYTVSLTITSPEGCVNDTVMTNLVEVYDYPTAGFDATPNPVDILNPVVEFVDGSSSDVVSYSWAFMNMQGGVLGGSSLQNPSYTFPDDNPDVYVAELTVTNADGCTDTETMEIVVNGVFTCYVPTAFTPDGDGVNDFFFVKGESIDAEVFNFSVYNKWGERIFEAEDMQTKWDGSYKGMPAQEDMYIWKLDTKDAVTGEHKEFTGHVILMR